MSVHEAVERDLAAIRVRSVELAGSALAATALAMAAEIDDPDNSATSKAMCAARLTETLALLRDLAPDEEECGPVDSLAARRAARLEGRATA